MCSRPGADTQPGGVSAPAAGADTPPVVYPPGPVENTKNMWIVGPGPDTPPVVYPPGPVENTKNMWIVVPGADTPPVVYPPRSLGGYKFFRLAGLGLVRVFFVFNGARLPELCVYLGSSSTPS